MTKTIAVLGAGQGLGAAVARRFGDQGYQVALVARHGDALAPIATDLRAHGVTAKTFAADLSDLDGLGHLLGSIADQLGPVDVLYFGATASDPHQPVQEVTAAQVAAAATLNTWAPIEAVRAVLPGMIERGSGSILYANAASAIKAAPGMSGPVAPALAATRNYLQALHEELEPAHVYVGALFVAAMIDGSAAYEQVRNWPGADAFPVVHADELAETLWQMHTARTGFEQVRPQYPAGREAA